MDVTICIPTKNGGEQLRQVLGAIFHQKTELTYEVICVDSGSVDQTLEIIRSFPEIRLHQISAAEFGHGKTRNLAASLGTGEFIIFLTQDAVPATRNWLEQMIRAMKLDPQIVLCFGAHYPYPDCNLLDRRDIMGHFRGMGLENTIYRMEDRSRYENDEGYRQLLAFSSDNNACVRRDIFQKYPYPDVDFSEDQIWTRQMIELGYSKVYCPFAPVYHSHNYPPKEYARRYYDEYKGIQKIHGQKMVPGALAAVRGARQMISQDVAYVRQQPMTYRQKFDWCKYVLRRDLGRFRAGYHAGKYVDASASRQKRMDRKYSQQYFQRNLKSSAGLQESAAAQPVVWSYRELWKYSPEIAAEMLGAEKQIDVESLYSYAVETDITPFHPEDYAAAKNGAILVNWVIPEAGKGSGGHLNIFRFVSAMERRGIHNRIYLLEPKNTHSDQEATDILRKNFPILDERIEIFNGCDGMQFCHAIVATGWTTAYFVRRFENTVSRFYFVQDYEPYFYPVGTDYKLAENTYRFGFRGITAGDWLKEKLEDEFRMPCTSFHFSYDKDLYHPIEKRDDKKRIFFYARPVTPRRGWELGLMALTRLAERFPDLEVVFAGWDVSNYYIPFHYTNAGTLQLTELAELYSQSDICLVMSLTNLSLLPLEVMASGGIIATQDDANNAWMVNSENAIIIDCDPVHIADTLANYLTHPEKLKALRENGIRYAQGTDWETEEEKVYQCIIGGVRKDEQSL